MYKSIFSTSCSFNSPLLSIFVQQFATSCTSMQMKSRWAESTAVCITKSTLLNGNGSTCSFTIPEISAKSTCHAKGHAFQWHVRLFCYWIAKGVKDFVLQKWSIYSFQWIASEPKLRYEMRSTKKDKKFQLFCEKRDSNSTILELNMGMVENMLKLSKQLFLKLFF